MSEGSQELELCGAVVLDSMIGGPSFGHTRVDESGEVEDEQAAEFFNLFRVPRNGKWIVPGGTFPD